MRRTRDRLGALALVLAVVLGGFAGGIGLAVATPSAVPAAYYGDLTVNGGPAPDGLVVTAEIDGEQRGSFTVETSGAYGGPGAFDPKLVVEGTDDDDGATVTFYVEGVQAGTATWESGRVERIDLAASGVDLPSEPTPEPTPEPEPNDPSKPPASGSPPPATAVAVTEPSRPPDAIQRASVSVRNASANQPVSIQLSSANGQREGNETTAGATRANVSLAGLNVTLNRDRDFTLDVTTREEPSATAPSFVVSDGTTGVGYLTIEHDVPDTEISDVGFGFRVSKDRISDTSLSTVALYRYHDGVWTELPTTLQGETATEYVYRSRSPGLSEFVIGITQPRFEVVSAKLDATPTKTEDSVVVRATVGNTGGALGTYQVVLRANGERLAERRLSVPAGGRRTVTFSQALDTGEYAITLNDVPVGTVQVDATATPRGETAGAGSSSAAPIQSGSTDQSAESVAETATATVDSDPFEDVLTRSVVGLLVLAVTLVILVRWRRD